MVTTNGLNLTGTTTDRNHHHRGFNCPADTAAAKEILTMQFEL
jgi:hypothetical protein